MNFARKLVKVAIGCIVIIAICTSCSGEEVFDIKMPHDDSYYEDLSLNKAIDELEALGFTNIETKELVSDPSEFDEVVNVDIGMEWFFEKGDVFSSNTAIEIEYHNRPSGFTMDNCEDLKTFLNGDNNDYLALAEKYDGEYVEFDAYIYKSEYNQYTMDNTIYVASGNYKKESQPKNIIQLDSAYATDSEYYDEYISEKTNVRVVGVVDLGYSKYYDHLFIDTYYLKTR